MFSANAWFPGQLGKDVIGFTSGEWKGKSLMRKFPGSKQLKKSEFNKSFLELLSAIGTHRLLKCLVRSVVGQSVELLYEFVSTVGIKVVKQISTALKRA